MAHSGLRRAAEQTDRRPGRAAGRLVQSERLRAASRRPRSVTTASQTSYPSSPRKRGASLIALLRLSPTEPAYPQGARRIRKAAEPLTAAQVLGFGGAPLDAEACCTRRGRCPHRPCWRGTLRGLLPIRGPAGPLIGSNPRERNLGASAPERPPRERADEGIGPYVKLPDSTRPGALCGPCQAAIPGWGTAVGAGVPEDTNFRRRS